MKNAAVTLVVGLLLLAPGVSAQDGPTMVFGIYYRCSQGMEAQADQAVQSEIGPVIQGYVDSGALSGWSWLTHVQGGAWRRALITIGNDLGQMMGVQEEINARLFEDHAEAMTEVGTACPGHDDYIWTGIDLSSNAPGTAGPASVSAYHRCERSREGRADEIFSELLAPLYQKHMDLGHLASYGYYGHRVGGPFRRLETVSGVDHLTVLNMQGAVYQEATANDPLAMQEFLQICNTHSDYMWTNAANN